MPSPQADLVVYVMSYQRPEYILSTIESILAQKNCQFDMIISENSNDDVVWKLLQANQLANNFKVIRRQPNLTAIDHFNKILAEAVSYQYLVVFHDDDLMKENFLLLTLSALTENPSLAAVSTNAFIIDGKTITSTLFNPYLKEDKIIEEPAELINHYLSPLLSHTPFPAYMYRTRSISGLYLEFNEGRKHADASFLVKVTEHGPVKWLHRPLIAYRRHAANDSTQINLQDTYSLYKFFRSKTKKHKNKMLLFIVKSFIKKLCFQVKDLCK